MKIFSWTEIKAKANCIDYMTRELGMQIMSQEQGWTRFNCPYRPGSDSGSFAAKKDGWYDHVEKKGGSIIDLVMLTRFNGDIWRSQEFLGEYLNLKPAQETKPARKFICAYDYVDLSGNIIHSTVRWEPKSFSQRRPHPERKGEWIYNLAGVEPILYRTKDWQESKWVVITEGEKDADGLNQIGIPATTNAGGAEKWRSSYNAHFQGKHVFLIPDNDDAGRAHARLVSWQLRLVAHQIRIINLPDLPPKGDVSDWIAAGGTQEQLQDLIRKIPPLDTTALSDPAAHDQEQSVAKQANKEPFANYRWEEKNTAGGETKNMRVPITINDLIADVHRRFWDFPRRVGGKMFDHDRKTGIIREITGAQSLFAWIAEKSGHEVKWAKMMEGAVSQEQLFYGLYNNALYYDMISNVPNWPRREDVYYTHGDLPEPTPDAKYLNEFCRFFNPETAEDAALLRVLVASPLYFKQKIDRPLWVIDSNTGRDSGKTKLPVMIAYLYGSNGDTGSPIWISFKEINSENNSNVVTKRVLSLKGRQKRIFLMDNITGHFKSSALATLVTQSDISGMAPYGYGEETRPNDLTFIATFNSASMDSDLISRSFFIYINRDDNPLKEWEQIVNAYIQTNRLHIISDIIGILNRGAQFEFTPASRCKQWEREILVPMVGRKEIHESIFNRNVNRKSEADGESQEAEEIRTLIITKLTDVGIDHESCRCWLPVKTICNIAKEAIPDYFKLGDRTIMHIVRNFLKGKVIPELKNKPISYPAHPPHTRGLMWETSSPNETATILDVTRDGVTTWRER